MLTRGKLSPVSYKMASGAIVDTYSGDSMVGQMQMVTALNKGQPFQPGVYRCNPTSMTKVAAECHPMGICKQSDSRFTYTVEGDLCAFSCYVLGYGPNGTRWSAYKTYNESRAQEGINKAYSKLMSSDLEIGVMLGELKETIEGLINPLSALKKFFCKKLFKVRDVPDMLSGTWLEWRYGIRPLMQDIQDIYEHVNSQLAEFDGKMHRRGGKTPVVEKLVKVDQPFSAGSWSWKLHGVIKTSTWYNAKVAYTLSRPLTWQERYGLSIYDLPSIAWELTRLSFVLDWFLSVGQWLAALKAINPICTVHGVSSTLRTDILGSFEIQDLRFRYQPVSFTASSYDIRLQHMQRKCIPPGFNTVTPALNTKLLDLNRKIDAVTLLWQSLPIRR